MCEPSPPFKTPQGNLYVATASRPAVSHVAPPQVQDANVEMKVAYPPLPTLPLLNLVPQQSRPVNWIPVAKLTGSLPSAFPQNVEEFDQWAWVVHTPNNYPDLH
jgi:hypothetical protein